MYFNKAIYTALSRFADKDPRNGPLTHVFYDTANDALLAGNGARCAIISALPLKPENSDECAGFTGADFYVRRAPSKLPLRITGDGLETFEEWGDGPDFRLSNGSKFRPCPLGGVYNKTADLYYGIIREIQGRPLKENWSQYDPAWEDQFNKLCAVCGAPGLYRPTGYCEIPRKDKDAVQVRLFTVEIETDEDDAFSGSLYFIQTATVLKVKGKAD